MQLMDTYRIIYKICTFTFFFHTHEKEYMEENTKHICITNADYMRASVKVLVDGRVRYHQLFARGDNRITN